MIASAKGSDSMDRPKAKQWFFIFFVFLLTLSLSACKAADESQEIVVTITSEAFPEPLLREQAILADTNGDGALSKQEISSVKKLHIKKLLDERGDHEDGPYPTYTEADFTIDLEGIQRFSSLTELTVNMLGGEVFVPDGPSEIYAKTKNFGRVYECENLTKLSLYEVDIPELKLSSLPNLKRLDLNCMYGLTKLDTAKGQNITFLWISQCHELEVLDLQSMDKLKTLNLVDNHSLSSILFGDANKKLETIQLNGLKNLKTADFSPLAGLVSLNIMDSALTDLDVSANQKLEQICAEGLELDTLDLTGNPYISYIINDGDSFKHILLADDNCVSMIRWTNSEITEFPVDDLNPATLTGIDIQGTKIKVLDVSAYPNLEHLYYDEDVTEVIH